MTKKDKVTVDEVVGLIHTDKPTDSVEEVRKLRGRENRTKKRFTIFGEWHKDCVIDEIRDNTGEYVTIGRVVDLLNENEQLKQSVNNLKETILKITIAYQRKYDRTIVDLVDEVHDEDITDLIKELQE